MIDISNNTRMFQGKVWPIQKWEVWWMTPFGITDTHDEAIQWCKNREFDPVTSIVPVPVAIDMHGDYEIYMRT